MFFVLNRCSRAVSVLCEDPAATWLNGFQRNMEMMLCCEHVRKNLHNRGTCPDAVKVSALLLHTIPVCMCAEKE